MVVPHDVDAQRIEPHRLHHLKPMLPVLNWNPRVVDLSCDDLGWQGCWELICCLEVLGGLRERWLLVGEVSSEGCEDNQG